MLILHINVKKSIYDNFIALKVAYISIFGFEPSFSDFLERMFEKRIEEIKNSKEKQFKTLYQEYVKIKEGVKLK